MIEGILRESKEKKSLIGLNFYGSENGFFCGYVVDFNNDFIILQHYSKFGIPDGILVHKLDDVKYFEKDTEYIKGIKLLIENKEALLKQTFSLSKRKSNLESFSFLMESFIGNRDQLVKFELNSGDIFFGFIEWCDEASFAVITIDCDGLKGKAIFKFEDIKLYWIDDLECRKRKIIYYKRSGAK